MIQPNEKSTLKSNLYVGPKLQKELDYAKGFLKSVELEGS